MRYLLRGETLLLNMSGGMMPMAGATILDTVESEELIWPDRHDDERITLSRWPQGRHWYLSSTTNRVFIPLKYVSYEEALKVARRYVPAARIRTKECGGQLPPE